MGKFEKIPEPVGSARADLIAAYAAGASLKKLGRQVGVSAPTMSTWFDRWGVLKRKNKSSRPATPEFHSRLPEREPPEVDRALVEKQHAEGVGLGRIAKQQGVTPHCLRALYRAWGLHIRNPREAAAARWEAENQKLNSYRLFP
ncbi:hypothetical protein ACWDRR_00845 [Kitasatospora sp. NPDC003701]